MEEKRKVNTAKRIALLMLLLVVLTETVLFVRENRMLHGTDPAAEQSDSAAEQSDPAAVKTGSSGLPARYDCREDGKTPVVKSQGKRGTCWALTATSALEAAFLPQLKVVFSADHMSLHNGFVITQKEGGDYKMIMAYLSGWYGPVLEQEDPYGDDRTTDGLRASAHVQQIRLLEGEDPETFKELILQSGPVQTSLYMDRSTTSADRSFYREDTCGYYFPVSEEPTHDVLLLGWDDTYAKENFALQPSRDGAWICQNTWGTAFGEDGIFYVSYEDANIARSGLAYMVVRLPDHYDRIYQTDVCGWQGRQGYDQPDCCFANVYTAQDEELLRAVGFYSVGAETSYEVSVVHDFADASSFVHRHYLTSGSLTGMGYFTVDLPQPEPLREGERFAVVVQVSTPGTDKPVAVELSKDSYTANVTTEGKEGYLSLYGGAWENTEEKFATNVCLKAYTSLVSDASEDTDAPEAADVSA